MDASDLFDLQRFVEAQTGVWETVQAELRAGQKRTHWMWFIFPQLRGLGSSATAERYGIRSRAEAEAYRLHPVLGPRLREASGLVQAVDGKAVEEIFPYPDNLKLHSSMTLFAELSGEEPIFAEVLRKYFNNARDLATRAKQG